MIGQNGQASQCGMFDGDDPMAVGRETLDRLRIFGRKRGPGLRRQERTRQIAPQQGRVILNLAGKDRMARQDRDMPLSVEPCKPLRVPRSAGPAVSIQIEVGHQPAVGGCRESVRVGGTGLFKGIGQGRECGVLQVIVDALQDKDIRIDAGDFRDQCGDLRIITAQNIAEQEAGALARGFGVEGRHPQRVSGGDCGEQPDQTGSDQAAW